MNGFFFADELKFEVEKMSTENTNNTSELNADTSSSNKSLKTLKTLSLSSTDSLCSSNDLNYDLNNPVKYLDEASTKFNKAQADYLIEDSNKASVEKVDLENEEAFDFSKTGAKPKKKKLPNTKSSLSSSTSSSLSSLISQCSNPNTNISSSVSSKKQSPSSFGLSKTSKKNDMPKSSSNKSSNWSCLDNDDDGSNENVSTIKNQNNDFNEITTCPLCYKVVRGQLEAHFMAEHREFECPFCGLLFDNDLVLNQHVNTVHNDDSNSVLPIKDLATSGTSKEISLDNLETIDSQEKNKLICPVCNLVINEGLSFLEIHVESHFNTDTSGGAMAVAPNDLMHFVQNSYSKQRSRTESVSSITANVDENFEIDQAMTFADGYSELNHNEDSKQFDFDYNSLRNGKFVN